MFTDKFAAFWIFFGELVDICGVWMWGFD